MYYPISRFDEQPNNVNEKDLFQAALSETARIANLPLILASRAVFMLKTSRMKLIWCYFDHVWSSFFALGIKHMDVPNFSKSVHCKVTQWLKTYQYGAALGKVLLKFASQMVGTLPWCFTYCQMQMFYENYCIEIAESI